LDVRWRPYYGPTIELFLSGVLLSVALGYALEESQFGVGMALVVAGLLLGDAIRRRGVTGLWVVALAFCASVSRLSMTETEIALGAFRVPLIAGGSLLAVALGCAVDREFRAAVKRTHP
jgi:hypothetical protein